ncbi:TBC1 domain family member 1 isoform X3 [Brienomyrus brachyistius]|uniref:TBC1 domain family member 1 isoform X3 n=1 Tax=Brienomyrus brachyistius TaxID=42636 RepID=UPI0020B34A8D|nr:TBC1 domain family member 1 isoform X3 [Brienomyrus brachyistius]
MEGLYFEVKRKSDSKQEQVGSQTDRYFLHAQLPQGGLEDGDEEVQYRLQLVGSLSVHPLTTMTMLPWIVAEIRRPQDLEKDRGSTNTSICAFRDLPVCLRISGSAVRCCLDTAPQKVWDPLHHTVLFEYRPHHIHKLIHNSQEPSYFGCLAREQSRSTCHVLRCEDHSKVPEIISTLRQAGKSSARQEEPPGSRFQDGRVPDDMSDAAAFAKKFEVLFCGRVCVAHKKAPPALIDECIEKFGHASGGRDPGHGEPQRERRQRGHTHQTGPLPPGPTLRGPWDGSSAQKTVFFRKDPSFPSLQALDENGLSPELHSSATNGPTGVQPTSIRENRTMLFTIGKSQIFLVSPDTKKVAMEKGFREISFCSQGIRHVDHFGFICRESLEGGSFQFVCYVFQCNDEALVDEIMLTLKQAFSVAALQQTSRTQSQQCEFCPMQRLHRLCERIEGLHPSKVKLELQKHLATLQNEQQASIFESILRARPKTEQEENELVVASLRSLYEELQRAHSHGCDGSVNQQAAGGMTEEMGDSSMSSNRQRLEQFTSRAKKSLAESLEGIWKGGGKSRLQREDNEGRGAQCSSSSSPLSRLRQEVSREDPVSPLRLPTSPLKAHNSTGDLQQLKAPSPDLQRPLLRRRASTFSHLPTPSPTGPPPPQEPTASTKPKLVRHYSVSTDSPHQSKPIPGDGAAPFSSPSTSAAQLVPSASSPSFFRSLKPSPSLKWSDVAALSSPAVVAVVGEDSPLRNRRHSWRQQIFLRVATPQKTCDTPSRYDDRDGGSWELGALAGLGPGAGESPLGAVPEERRRRSRAELRELWRKAVLQQILLLRMERENLKLQASENDLQNKRLKLVYEEITPCLKDVTQVWEKMLGTVGRAKIKFDMEKIHAAVGQGVPRQHRGEIWKFLSEQYLLRQPVTSHPPGRDTPYKELLKQLTSHQHAILVDLGRTFPTHPYFSAQLGAGQLSLYNLLKAYSLLDPEVGYCQGLSFVAGVLLLHMDEREAYGLLRFLMFDMGLRRQYRPDMIILQVQMYQLSRLLHDYHRDLYCHLEQHEIGPSLYAAPWFLTAFASHFPLGFVARVFDMLFLQGSEVIFKVALSLLGSHKPLILQHDNLEAIVDFIKTTLPNLGLVQMEKTINQVFEMDLSKQLQAYEVEYHVLQDELLDGPSPLSQAQRAAQLEKAISSLRQQNLDLLEELQVAHAKIRSLESNVEGLLGSESGLRQEVCALERDRAELTDTVAVLRAQLACVEGQGVGPSTNGPPPLM